MILVFEQLQLHYILAIIFIDGLVLLEDERCPVSSFPYHEEQRAEAQDGALNHSHEALVAPFEDCYPIDVDYDQWHVEDGELDP